MTIKMDSAALTRFMQQEFPQVTSDVIVGEPDTHGLTVTLVTSDRHLRPGNTVSGPTLFTLADVAFYLLILSRIGPEALTVTTGATINFMRKPVPGQLFGDARILKQGKSLIVGDVVIYNGDDDARTAPVAHAQMTYSVPPTRGRS